MREDRKNRLVNIVPVPGSTDVSLNLRVDIKIIGSLPIVSMSQKLQGVAVEDIDSSIIEYDKSVNTGRLGVASDDEFKNALFDVAYVDRFVHMAFASSVASKYNAYLVYDKKYKDVLLVPNLRSLGDGVMRGFTVDIEAWVIGVGMEPEFDSHLLPVDTTSVNISEPLNKPYSTVHSMLLSDTSKHTNNNYGYELDNGYGESDKLGIRDFIGLGDSLSLFGAKVPTYRMVEHSLKRVSYIYVGMQDVNDVLIPMPF